MSGGHGPAGRPGGVDALHVPGASPLHRARPEVKIAAALLALAAVVATPGRAVWAFGLHAAVLGAVVAVAGLPPALVARRLRIELPFLAFAVFLPVVGGDPRVAVLGVSLSEPGLWAAWTIAAKGTLGVATSVVLAATTTVPDLLRGLERLRVPRVVTAIAGFMVRYLAITLDEAARMHVARQSRGYDPRWLGQARGVAASAGTLFVRAFERGERVHLAMVSRGYTGTMPHLDGPASAPGPAGWAAAALVPAAAWAVAAAAWVAA
ncbi:MAG TPA: cobalt ECF transporter T component CbiQ [Acidimicrobiales bacterium]